MNTSKKNHNTNSNCSFPKDNTVVHCYSTSSKFNEIGLDVISYSVYSSEIDVGLVFKSVILFQNVSDQYSEENVN